MLLFLNNLCIILAMGDYMSQPGLTFSKLLGTNFILILKLNNRPIRTLYSIYIVFWLDNFNMSTKIVPISFMTIRPGLYWPLIDRPFLKSNLIQMFILFFCLRILHLFRRIYQFVSQNSAGFFPRIQQGKLSKFFFLITGHAARTWC